MNNVVLIGRLTKDIEIRKTDSGTSVADFALAVGRNYKQGDQKVTDFIPCTAWAGTADFIAKYFAKGVRMAVNGAIETSKYVDKDGNNRTSIRVKVSNAEFADGKRDSTPAPAEQAEPPEEDGDLPF